MYISDVLKRSGRNLRQAKARTILTSLAIGVGAFALTLTLAASNGAKSFVDDIISDNFDPAELIVVKSEEIFEMSSNESPKEYSENFSSIMGAGGALVQIETLTSQDVESLRKIDGVENVRLGLVAGLKYVTRDGQKKYIATTSAINPFQKIDLLAGDKPKQSDTNKVIIPQAWLSSFGFANAQDAIGQEITLVGQKAVSANEVISQLKNGIQPDQLLSQQASTTDVYQEKFVISGVLQKPSAAQQPGTQLYLLANEPDVQRFQELATIGTPDYQKYENVYVRIKNGENESVLKEAQQRIEKAGYATMSIKDTQDFLNQAINVLQTIVAAFSFIAVIASLFGVINTMYISVLQRTREIGLMKALGMRKRDVSRLFRFEAAWIGFLGGAIGSGLAVFVGYLLNPTITKSLELGEGKVLLEFHAIQILALIIGLMFVAVFAGLFPARKAAKLDPIEALRTE